MFHVAARFGRRDALAVEGRSLVSREKRTLLCTIGAGDEDALSGGEVSDVLDGGTSVAEGWCAAGSGSAVSRGSLYLPDNASSFRCMLKRFGCLRWLRKFYMRYLRKCITWSPVAVESRCEPPVLEVEDHS